MDFPLSITPVLEALEEQVVLLRLFSELEQDAHGIAVGIGTENQYGALTEASVVATGYGPGEQAMIGVLGPTRMNYPDLDGRGARRRPISFPNPGRLMRARHTIL